MRLIDAERLRALIVAMYEPFPNICNVNVILTAIDNAPTIEAEPVRHGRWNDKPDEYSGTCIIRHCSECGWSVFKGNPLYDFGHWNYCPNCGAYMREEGAENG